MMRPKRITPKKEKILTKYGLYDVMFEPEPDMGGFMVSVPRCADVVSWGKTLAHARKMAKEAIECSLEGDAVIASEQMGFVALTNQRDTKMLA